MITLLDHHIDLAFWWVISASVDASLTIVPVALLCVLARRWLHLKHALLLWMVVWFNFLVPGFVSWDVDPAVAPGIRNIPVLVATPPADPVHGFDLTYTADTQGEAAVAPVVPERTTSILAPAPRLWLLTALVLAVRAYLAGRYWRRGRAELTPRQGDRVRPVLSRAADDLGLKRVPPVYTHPAILSPAVTGWWRASITLPAAQANTMDDDTLYLVFLHELAHIQRGDHRLNAVVHVVTILHWFNPLVYLARRETRIGQECRCDARVVEVIGQENASAYGNRLLDLVQTARWTIAPVAALPIVSKRSQLTRRIVMLSKPHPDKNFPLRLAPLFMLALLAASIKLTLAQPPLPMDAIPVETYPPNYPGGIFQPGDSIEIFAVSGTAPEFTAGEIYTAHGAYTLGSAPEARIAFLATGGSVNGENWRTVKRGSGTFTLTGELTKAGDLHVSYYPAEGGSGFGGIYFRSPQSNGDIAAPTIPIAFNEATPTWATDQEQSGNGITIQRVLGTRTRFERGGVYTIEGRYTLRTEDRAQLIFYATNGTVESVSYDQPNGIQIEQGSGHFRLTARMTAVGVPHISMYPAEFGEGFFNRYIIEAGADEVPPSYILFK